VLVSRREFHLGDFNYDQITDFVNKLRDYLSTMQIPSRYSINIEKDIVACCGIFPLGAIIDIEGDNELIIRDLDFQLYAKMIELCEHDDINIHETQPLEIL
jgi:hypothetical protein